MAEGLKRAIPSFSYKPDSEHEASSEPTEQSVEAFKKKIELLLESDKKKKAATKEKKKTERFAKQRAWSHTVKRVQRYLGVRGARHNHTELNSLVGRSLESSGLSKYSISLIMLHIYLETQGFIQYLLLGAWLELCYSIQWTDFRL
jgi:hypothetical protein